jgi:hypothetical protein
LVKAQRRIGRRGSRASPVIRAASIPRFDRLQEVPWSALRNTPEPLPARKVETPGRIVATEPSSAGMPAPASLQVRPRSRLRKKRPFDTAQTVSRFPGCTARA